MFVPIFGKESHIRIAKKIGARAFEKEEPIFRQGQDQAVGEGSRKINIL